MSFLEQFQNAKTKMVLEFAKKFGLETIEIKAAEHDLLDFIGLPLTVDEINQQIDKIVEEEIAMINPFREINVGDTVLAEIQKGVVVTAVVDAIDDGIAYLLGDDGEPYSCPVDLCDKVPF
jgi:hypothetical protein